MGWGGGRNFPRAKIGVGIGIGMGGGGEEKKPKHNIKQVAIFTKIEGFPVSRIFLGQFTKLIFAEGSFNQKPLVFRENPRTHLEVQGPFGDEGTYPRMSKILKFIDSTIR